MWSILKKGPYIMYGPKVVPNPYAEGPGGGGGTYSILTGGLKLQKSGSGTVSVSYIQNNDSAGCVVPDYATINTTGTTFQDIIIDDGYVCVRQQSVVNPVVTGDGVESFQNVSIGSKYFTVIKISDPSKLVTVVF